MLATVCVCVLKYIERLFACLQPVLAVRLNSPCVNIVPLFTDVWSPDTTYNSFLQRGNTALHDASTEGHIHITLLLLALGASVIARTRDGLTCLMCACAAGHLQLAKLLLAAGCDLHTCNKVRCVCLWWC